MLTAPAIPGLDARRPRVLWWLAAGDWSRFFAGWDDGIAELKSGQWAPIGIEPELGLRSTAPDVVVTGWETPPLPAAWLGATHCSVKYVCHLGGSVRRWVPRSFIERGGVVTNWGGAATESVAEHALLLALAALRDLRAWPGGSQSLPPGKAPATRTLRGKRVGIHGFGGIAQALVRLLRPFAVEVTAWSAGVPSGVFSAHQVREAVSLEALLAGSEVFFECEALTPATTGSLTAERLARLPDGAAFVNVGRGRVVDESALIAEAKSGRLRVAVDVLENEPITAASALCQVPGAIVSPHIAGPTREEYAAIGRSAWENVQRYGRGEPLANVVTLELYDRST